MTSGLILTFLLLALVYISARYVRPAGDQTGKPILTSASPVQRLKIATYNIQMGKNLDGSKRDINQSAAVLADSDLAGVQEVRAAGWRSGLSQTQSLAQPDGLTGVFAATRRRWFRDERGNAVLTRLNVSAWRSLMLPNVFPTWPVSMLPKNWSQSYRNMMIFEIEWQGSSFHFINTHLHTKDGREQQLELVLAEAAKYPRVILVGDFNSEPDTSQLVDTIAAGDLEDAITLAGVNSGAERRVDWILTRGFQIHSGRYLPIGVSDHPFYEVSLSYK